MDWPCHVNVYGSRVRGTRSSKVAVVITVEACLFVQMLMANDNEDNVLIVVFSVKWDHTNKLVPKDHHSRFNLIVASHIVRR